MKINNQIPAYKMSNNVDDLFDEIIPRKYWNEIDENIIKAIIRNANGNAESIRNFVYISEYSNVLQNNFLQLSKINEINKDFLLSLFSLTLYRLGDGYHQAIASKNDEDFKELAMLADMAFMSSILCDKFMLGAYHGMAFLYSFWVDGKTSLEFCKKYKTMEDELLNTSDELLNYMQRATKDQLLHPENLEKTIEEIKKYAPHLLELSAELPGPYSREAIEKLERKIRSR